MLTYLSLFFLFFFLSHALESSSCSSHLSLATLLSRAAAAAAVSFRFCFSSLLLAVVVPRLLLFASISCVCENELLSQLMIRSCLVALFVHLIFLFPHSSIQLAIASHQLSSNLLARAHYSSTQFEFNTIRLRGERSREYIGNLQKQNDESLYFMCS